MPAKVKKSGSDKVYRCKLLVGIHQDRSGEEDENGKPTLVTYHKGDVVESSSDLEKVLGSEKFRTLNSRSESSDESRRPVQTKKHTPSWAKSEEDSDEPTVVEPPDEDELRSMTREQLIEVAEREGVALPEGKSKPKVLKAILEAREGSTDDDEETEEDEE